MTTPLLSAFQATAQNPRGVRRYSELASKIASGECGPEAKNVFDCLTLAHASARATNPKTASLDDNVEETEDESRKRRIGELLRRRTPTGLDTGSAPPTPPRENTQ